MARIVGVDIPNNKRGEIALTYIFGIGRSRSLEILEKAGVDKDIKVNEWNDDQFSAIRKVITDGFKVEGELRSENQMSIQAINGHWLLSRNSSSFRPTGSRTKYQKQCPYP